jgi:methylphosphotriester-DNA--protein-cysteine methyltransferase
MPIGRRGGGAVSPARPTKAIAGAALARLAGARPCGRASPASSTSVFQAPHASHLPAHFGAAAPHSWQTNWRTGRAITR